MIKNLLNELKLKKMQKAALQAAKKDMMDNIQLRESFLKMKQNINAIKIVSPGHLELIKLQKNYDDYCNVLRSYDIDPEEFIKIP